DGIRDGHVTGVQTCALPIYEVKPEMQVYKDEIFGPVLGVTRVDTYDEAVRLVNENPYGNGVAIFTRDGGAARQFQFDVNVGMVRSEERRVGKEWGARGERWE